MIILGCIILWLLTGFAGVYFGYRFCDKRQNEYTLGIVVILSVFGLATLLSAISYWVYYNFPEITIFERKGD